MYRDFLYLDMDRVQSVLAQLQEGVLKEIITGNTKDLGVDATITAGLLSKLIPISIEGNAGYQTSSQASKILHDYAFTLARQSLRDSDLVLDVEDWNRDELPIPIPAFIEVAGSASILDYELMGRLADNEDILNFLGLGSFASTPAAPRPSGRSKSSTEKRSPKISPPNGPLKMMKDFVDVFWGNALQIRFQHASGLMFVGTLTRSFLREDSRSFIFKYGNGSQTGWNMFAQVNAIPERGNRLSQLPSAIGELQAKASHQKSEAASAVDAVDVVLEMIQTVQAAAASVSYPAIAVTPLAVFRELEPFR